MTTPLPRIFYEDPEPVEDGIQQAPIIVEMAHMLTAHFKSEPEVFVSAGGFIFYDPDNGNRRIAPDLYIAFDVDAEGIWENLPNYLDVANRQAAGTSCWRWRRRAPRPTTWGTSATCTPDLGIAEYWRLDPTGGDLYGQPLSGDRLADGEYRLL